MWFRLGVKDVWAKIVISFREDYISSTGVYKKIPVLGTDRATTLVDWVFRKWPLERDGELNGAAMAWCLVRCAVCFRGLLYDKENIEVERSWFFCRGGHYERLMSIQEKKANWRDVRCMAFETLVMFGMLSPERCVGYGTSRCWCCTVTLRVYCNADQCV